MKRFLRARRFWMCLASIMTLNALDSDLNGVHDLRRMKVATLQSSSFSEYLDQRAISYVPFAVNTSMYLALEKGEVDAVFYDFNSVEYYAKWVSKGQAQTVGPVLQPSEQAFFFTEDHPLTDGFNLALLQLKEDGRWQKIYDRYFRIDNDEW